MAKAAVRAAENFRFFADLIVAQSDDTYKVPGSQVNYVNRKPIGVAGLITPWNFPLAQGAKKVAAALAALETARGGAHTGPSRTRERIDWLNKEAR